MCCPKKQAIIGASKHVTTYWQMGILDQSGCLHTSSALFAKEAATLTVLWEAREESFEQWIEPFRKARTY